jgi:hypothetical protein
VRVGNDIVSLLAPLQRRQNAIVNISGTKNPFDFNAAHQTAEINKVGDQFIGMKEGSGRRRKKKEGGMMNDDDDLDEQGKKRKPNDPEHNRKMDETNEQWAKRLAEVRAKRAAQAAVRNAKATAAAVARQNRLAALAANPRPPKVIPAAIVSSQKHIDSGKWLSNFPEDKFIKHFGKEETARLLAKNAENLAKRQGASGSRDPLQEGSGTLPVISSVEGLQRLIKVEQARLRKIAKGYEYESSTMTKEKIQEKIARLKDRLKSAKANKGHADVSYFIPKSIKWLKIMATETRLGSDAYNKMLLDAINKLLTELGAKKQTPATKKKTATLNEDRVKLEQMIKPKKKGYSKETPDANKPNPVLIPVSSLTNERANIRAATQRQRNYNKVLSDKEEENINVMVKAFSPIPQAPEAPQAPRSKADERREKARLRAAQQRQEPGHNTRQVEINRANRERTRLAKSIGVPIQEYSRARKEYAKNERIIASLEDEAQRQVIRDAQRALAAKYKFSYLDEVVSSDNTVPNMVIAADAGPPPAVVESEVEPAVAPIVGSGMCGGSLGYSGRDPKYIMSGKNEEYYLLH